MRPPASHALRALVLPAALALAACATPWSGGETRPERAGVHDVWESALERTADALRRDDRETARVAVLEAVGEAVYFPARDPRTSRTEQALDALLAAYGRRGAAEAAISLIEAVGEAARAGVPDHPLRLYAVVRRAQLLTELGRPEDVDATLAEAAKQFDASLGSGHPFAVRARVLWAGNAAGRGAFEEAEASARRALDDGERALGPRAAEVGEALAVLGRILLARGRAAEAIPLLERALAIAEAGTGAESLPSAQTRIALADAALQSDALLAARHHYERALPAIEEHLGPHSPLRAVVLYRLGRIHFLRGELLDAKRRTRESLAVAEPLATPDDLAVAGTLLSLAEIEFASGRVDEAQELSDGLATLLERLDPDDPRSSLALASPLGSLEARMGRFERAEPLVRRGLAAAEATSGADSLASAARRNDLAYLYVRMGQTEAAAVQVERALPIIERATGKSSTPYALGLDTFGLVRVRQGRAEEGRAALESAAAILGPAFGPDSPVLLEVLEHYAEALTALDDPAAADVIARIAQTRRRRDEMLDQTPGRNATRVAFRSARFGYAVELPGDLWSPWPEVTSDMPSAEFGALHGDVGGFAVVPVDYFGTQPEARFALPSLLALIETEAPPDPQVSEVAGTAALEVVTARLHGGVEYRYRARALSRADAGYVVVAWVALGRGADETEVLSAIDQLTLLDEPRPPLQPAALSASERHRHGAALNEIGLRYAQGGRYARAIEILERAVEVASDDPTVLENLVRIQIASGRYGAALAALDTGVDRFADHPQLRAYRALAAVRTGDHARAIADYERAFALGLEDEGFFGSYVDTLWEAGRREEAVAALDARIDATGSIQLRARRAALLRRGGDVEGALADLEALQASGEPTVLTELVIAYAELGRHQEAIASCNRVIEQLGPSADVYAARARSEYALGWYREAAASLERALALEPGATDLQELAAHVNALVGQGENALLREPLEPVAVPEHLLTGGSSPNGAGDRGASYEFWSEAMEFEPGRSLRRTTWFRARVHDARGVDQLASLEIPFHPLYERIFVNEVTVRDASGAVVGEGSPADYYVLDPPEAGQATSSKTLHVPIPGLAPGTTLEVRITRREHQPPERFPYLDHRFSRLLPVGRSALTIRGDVSRLVAHVSPGVEAEEDPGRLTWWIDEPPPARWEPLLPPGRPDLPSAHVGDRSDSWSTLAHAYLAELEPYLAEDPAAAALADELLEGLPRDDREASVRALSGVARERLTYAAIEFGSRARIPQPVSATLSRRYGDCKDHALLLVQLLRHAGLSANLALVNRSKAVDPAVPALDQFDHMIVHCPDCGGAGFVDPTDKDFAGDAGVPRQLGGAAALILDPDDPRLVTIPLDDPQHHFLDIHRTVHIDAEGGARVAETVILGGSVAASIRGALRSVEPSEWEDVFRQRLAGDLPRSRLQTLEIAHAETPEEPLEVTLEYEVRALLADTGRSLVGRLPAIWEHQMLAVPPTEGRRAPFALGNPLQIKSHTDVIVPGGHAVRGGPSRRDALRAEFVRWSGSVERAPDGLALRLELTRPPGRFPADDYPRFREESAQALGFLDAAIEVEPRP
jgi:tetratricopeptide (TPR) repeat protein